MIPPYMEDQYNTNLYHTIGDELDRFVYYDPGNAYKEVAWKPVSGNTAQNLPKEINKITPL